MSILDYRLFGRPFPSSSRDVHLGFDQEQRLVSEEKRRCDRPRYNVERCLSSYIRLSTPSRTCSIVWPLPELQ